MISRRRFIVSAALASSTFGGTRLFAAPQPFHARHLYIGTGRHGQGEGLMMADWNDSTGTIANLRLAAEVSAPTFLAIHRGANGRGTLYAVGGGGDTPPKVSAFSIEPASGRLTLLNQVDPAGAGPVHLSVTPDGSTVLVANYGGGSVSSFRVRADGSLTDVVSHYQFSGAGPNKERQSKAHTHSAVTSLDGRFALVNDLGIDRIMIFQIDPATSKLSPADSPFWSARAGSGPRHLAWNPNGKYVYCANELDSTVDVLAWNSSPANLRSIDHVSTLPPDFPPHTAYVGEIVASRDGRNVYAGNRVGDNTIAVFDVNQKTGLLKLAQLAGSGGTNSRHVAIDPTNHWLIASHVESQDLVVIPRNPHTGRLGAPAGTYSVREPMCVVF